MFYIFKPSCNGGGWHVLTCPLVLEEGTCWRLLYFTCCHSWLTLVFQRKTPGKIFRKHLCEGHQLTSGIYNFIHRKLLTEEKKKKTRPAKKGVFHPWVLTECMGVYERAYKCFYAFRHGVLLIPWVSSYTGINRVTQAVWHEMSVFLR